MSEYVFKLPDLGEGTVEAEIIEWHVTPGDVVREGDVIVDVMTDKANIEVPSPASGTVLRTTGQPGDMVAVGAELIALQTGAVAADDAEPKAEPVAAQPEPEGPPPQAQTKPAEQQPRPEQLEASEAIAPIPQNRPTRTGKPLASPAIRRRASELGIDLATIQGSGPKGRILRRDLEDAPAQAPQVESARAEQPTGQTEEIKVIGVRRLIAERMQQAKRTIPHFAYVEEVDITALEQLRTELNNRSDTQRLTYLPFVAAALCRALTQHTQCNQLFDEQRGVLVRHEAVHLGVATQTPDGLKVPVVRNANALDLHQLHEEIGRVTSRAKAGQSKPQELSGSTITITSLGKLGGIVSTPVINAPEMCIIGVNKAALRPMVVDGAVVPRLMMNLSSSFDHRFVDGFDAASMIQELRTLLEIPALIFSP